MRFIPARLVVLALTALALVPATASAAQRYVAIPGVNGPGPARYDRSYVLKVGPDRARNVLVLVPGFLAGAGDFRLIAHQIVDRVPNLQVWAQDRRSNGLEDLAGLRSGNAATAFGYYLGGQALAGRRFAPVRDADVPYSRRWGLSVALGDLRRVVLAARRGGRRVILGGHSLGASTASIYPAWDFGGRPGYKDLAGIVLIDGGARGAFREDTTLATVRRELASLRSPRTSPFAALVPGLPPYLQGVFVGVAGLAARTRPNEPSILQPAVRGLLPTFTTPFALTNEAQFGYAFDQDTGPRGLELIRVNSGRLAASGTPRRWVDGGISPIQNLAKLMSGVPDFAEWYFPRRLSLDVAAASSLSRNPVTRLLGLRPWHFRAVDRPLYAFQSNLTHGGVLRAARAYVRGSRIGRRAFATFASDRRQNHLDQFTATPAKNTFLKSVVPFLRRVVRGR